jgi:hypothetical protein
MWNNQTGRNEAVLKGSFKKQLTEKQGKATDGQCLMCCFAVFCMLPEMQK